MTYPRSPFDTLGGLIYLPRMLDKIRLRQRGALSDYYAPMLGKGFDERICRYLGIDYAAVAEQVAAGLSDEAIFAWIQAAGAPLNEQRIEVWNGFASKRGWNDSGSPTLRSFKEERGFADRADIVTFFDFIELDEQRRT